MANPASFGWQQYLLNVRCVYVDAIREHKTESPRLVRIFFSCYALKRGILCRDVNSTESKRNGNRKTKWTEGRWLYVTHMMVLVCACLIR